jgi:hypothetical protein
MADRMRYFKDHFLTDDFFIRGHVATGGGRLSALLNSPHKQFLEVEEATCIKWEGHCIHTIRAVLRVAEILMAHEAAEAGDEALRTLVGRQSEMIEVAVHLTGRAQLEMRGKLRRNIYERENLGPHQFIILTEPQFVACDGAAGLLKWFPGDLPYVIVNRGRISLIHT